MKLSSKEFASQDDSNKASRAGKRELHASAQDKHEFMSMMETAKAPIIKGSIEDDLAQSASDAMAKNARAQFENELWKQQFADPVLLNIQQIQQMHVETPNMHESAQQSQANTRAESIRKLFEKKVKQLLVDAGAKNGDSQGTVMLRLDDNTFGTTELLLKRTSRGWELSVETQDRDLLASIDGGSGELAERFSQLGIGDISVSSSMKLR